MIKFRHTKTNKISEVKEASDVDGDDARRVATNTINVLDSSQSWERVGRRAKPKAEPETNTDPEVDADKPKTSTRTTAKK